MHGPVLFVINPIAGDHPVEPFLQELDRWANQQDEKVSRYQTCGHEDDANIREILLSEVIDLLVAVGGDGTLQMCAVLAREMDLKLGHIPRGSANGMAEELNLPAQVTPALRILERGRIRHCDMLRFPGERYGFHISDIGLNAALVGYYQQSGRRGFLAYASGIGRVLSDQRPFRVVWHCNGQRHEEMALMVALANARHYGSGAVLNTIGKPDDGLFELCVLRELGLTTVARHFLDLLDEDSEHLAVYQCNKLSLQLDRPVEFQIDGEVQDATLELEVEIAPRCLKMIVP